MTRLPYLRYSSLARAAFDADASPAAAQAQVVAACDHTRRREQGRPRRVGARSRRASSSTDDHCSTRSSHGCHRQRSCPGRVATRVSADRDKENKEALRVGPIAIGRSLSPTNEASQQDLRLPHVLVPQPPLGDVRAKSAWEADLTAKRPGPRLHRQDAALRRSKYGQGPWRRHSKKNDPVALQKAQADFPEGRDGRRRPHGRD